MRETAKRAVLIVGLVAAACEDQPIERPAVAELSEGLNLIDVTDPSWGIAGAFVREGRAVYFETRVGAVRPAIYRESWPDDPPNEMDVRFVDQEGLTFYAERGGDVYVDATWDEDIAVALATPVDRSQRDEDFRLARAAAAALLELRPEGLESHVQPMKAVAMRPIPAEDRSLRIVRSTDEVAYGVAGGITKTQLYAGDTGCLCFGGCCLGQHSATRSTNAAGTMVLNSCNHGRCWDGDDMGYKCETRNYLGATVNGETNSNTTAVSAGCATPYDWASGGHDHLCNDDSAYELWQTRNGNTGSNAVWGTGGGSLTFQWFDAYSSKGNSYFACDCEHFNECDNDWGHPSCPPSVDPPAAVWGAQCQGYCGGYSTAGCYCDAYCVTAGDCCPDGTAASICGFTAPATATTSAMCDGFCGGYSSSYGCYCDSLCAGYGDCCSDGSASWLCGF